MYMRVRVKKGVAVLTAIGILGAGIVGLEGVLRLGGVGAEGRTVFRTLPGQPAYQVLNAAYAQRYFSNGFVPTVAFEPFPKEKPPGTFRVMALGGNVTAGFPYRSYLGFPARLQRRLEAYALGQPIEVVNLGIPATNSYTLWDLKEAVVAQQPDAVILYTGHSEYYGAFGVGGTLTPPVHSVWMKRLVLRLKHFVLYTWLEGLSGGRREPEGQGGTLLAQAIRDDQITLDGPVYEDGLAQFETNLRAVLKTFREAGIPVYLGTLASNLRDQVPLGEREGAPDDFMWGRTLWEQGDTAGARAALLEAKEKDEIRLRAPEAFNDVIRDLAREHQATLVDVQQVAMTASENMIEDQSFFDDLVHPSWRGYDLIAGAFFDALKGHPVLVPGGVSTASGEGPKPSAFERAYGFLNVFNMQAGFPFKPRQGAELDEMAFIAMLMRYRGSGNYQDTLTYKTVAGEQSVQEVLPTVISIARSKADTLTALLLYRSQLHWHRFDENVIAEAVSFAAVSVTPEHIRVGEEIVLQAINLTGKAEYFIVLASLKLCQGHVEEAARLVALAESRAPDVARLDEIKARLEASGFGF